MKALAALFFVFVLSGWDRCEPDDDGATPEDTALPCEAVRYCEDGVLDGLGDVSWWNIRSACEVPEKYMAVSDGLCVDCADYDASIYPGAPDEPGDLTDSDCDGLDD